MKQGGKEFTRAQFLSRAAFGVGAAWASTIAGGFPQRALAHVGDPDHGGHPDAYTHAMRDYLNAFITWLGTNKGYIGELETPNNYNTREGMTYLGYPDEQFFGALGRPTGDGPSLGELYLARCDAAGIWYTMQEVSEWYYQYAKGGYHASIYRAMAYDAAKVINTPAYSAGILERHAASSPFTRGVNFSGGQRFTSKMSSSNPGAYDIDYWYPTVNSAPNDPTTGMNSFQFLASRSVKLVRLGFRWERMQPVLGKSLNQTELSRYKQCIANARAAGLSCVIDLHNYGGYFTSSGRKALGSSGCSAQHFVDVWKRLSLSFQNESAVVGYDIMNEPHVGGGIAKGSFASPEKAWESYSQKVVSAIRGRGDTKKIMVPLYAHLEHAARKHLKPWITNGQDIMYTAHHYFDHYFGPNTGGGNFLLSYTDENAYWQSRGY